MRIKQAQLEIQYNIKRYVNNIKYNKELLINICSLLMVFLEEYCKTNEFTYYFESDIDIITPDVLLYQKYLYTFIGIDNKLTRQLLKKTLYFLGDTNIKWNVHLGYIYVYAKDRKNSIQWLKNNLGLKINNNN